MRVLIPPLKIQGIKTKLVSHIKNRFDWNEYGIYFEPFMGSGVVGFNIAPKRAIFSDNNPHIINFYTAIQNGIITVDSAKNYLIQEGSALQKYGQEYYLKIRERFNKTACSFDFLFLNRSCFNGLMRFNKNGGFNVPYCKKDKRFSQSYITKIINQIDWVSKLIQNNEYEFIHCDFTQSLKKANQGDFIYCDPPYIDRHSDYFNTWSETQEKELFEILSATEAKFILSTWHSNQYRSNAYVATLWNHFDSNVIEHFYHLGANENNRNAVKEALIQNYFCNTDIVNSNYKQQKSLFME